MITKQNRSAFSRIELIVVVVAVAAVTAMVIPVNTSRRQQAEKIICNSNLRDMGNMLGMYALDNDGRMVSNGYYGGRWWDLLGSYYGKTRDGSSEDRYRFKLFMCPTQWRKTRLEDAGPGFNPGVINPDGGIDLGLSHMYIFNTFFYCPYNPVTETKSFPQYWWSKYSSIKMPSTLPIYWDHDI